jgi:hypothetical protein
MKFMMIVKGAEDFGTAGPPPQSLMEAIDKLGQEATKAGKMVTMGGLQPTSKGASLRLKGGKIITKDGPFTEAKEMIGGFTILELPSKEAAIEEARKFMELHRIHWPGWEGETEIREMYENGEHP